eukprot:PhF_6_TR21170/c2_g1_i3/m.30507
MLFLVLLEFITIVYPVSCTFNPSNHIRETVHFQRVSTHYIQVYLTSTVSIQNNQHQHQHHLFNEPGVPKAFTTAARKLSGVDTFHVTFRKGPWLWNNISSQQIVAPSGAAIRIHRSHTATITLHEWSDFMSILGAAFSLGLHNLIPNRTEPYAAGHVVQLDANTVIGLLPDEAVCTEN